MSIIIAFPTTAQWWYFWKGPAVKRVVLWLARETVQKLGSGSEPMKLGTTGQDQILVSVTD